MVIKNIKIIMIIFFNKFFFIYELNIKNINIKRNYTCPNRALEVAGLVCSFKALIMESENSNIEEEISLFNNAEEQDKRKAT